MKKIIIISVLAITIAGLTVAFTVLGRKEENKSEVTSNKQTTAAKSYEVSYESLMAMEQSPAKEFDVQENTEGGQTVVHYLGTAEMIYIPDEINGLPVTEISKYTFANDIKTPKAIRLGKNVKTLEFGSFGTNTKLEIFVAGEGLEVIENSAFIGAKGLKVVKLNEGLKEIERLAFTQLKSLREIEIPSTVEKFGEGIFTFCDKSLVVKGKAGSLAEQIAKDNDLKYEEIK